MTNYMKKNGLGRQEENGLAESNFLQYNGKSRTTGTQQAERDFINEDFLLSNDTARMLYHEHAEKMPIIDYHCHLNPREIAENKNFDTLTQIWLYGDHYKWRALRANGVNEAYITGKETSDWEKFEKWAATVPYLMRNPLYHWTHLELKTAFGIGDVLNPSTARSIYERCNELLQRPEFRPQSLIRRYKVEAVCTTDDPADSLEYHRQLAGAHNCAKVLPAWRPDKAMNVDAPQSFREYMERLEQADGQSISNFEDLIQLLERRHRFFHAQGCRLADHGLRRIPVADYTEAEVRAIFDKAYSGQEVTAEEAEKYQTALLHRLLEMNAEAGWTQQIHYGPLRNINTRMFRQLGPDSGYDTIGDFNEAEAFSRLLDHMEKSGKLAKTILYNINGEHNDMLAAMAANFQDGTVPGKMQFGAAWWFNDHYYGIIRQLNSISEQGLLSRFVGMLTDSRSFLSYPRHEYFRRILCDLIGQDVENGMLPKSEMERIAGMVEDICYYNAKRYLNI